MEVALSTTSRPPARMTRRIWGHQPGYSDRSEIPGRPGHSFGLRRSSTRPHPHTAAGCVRQPERAKVPWPIRTLDSDSSSGHRTALGLRPPPAKRRVTVGSADLQYASGLRGRTSTARNSPVSRVMLSMRWARSAWSSSLDRPKHSNSAFQGIQEGAIQNSQEDRSDRSSPVYRPSLIQSTED